jgi:predicted nucleotidyltransferase
MGRVALDDRLLREIADRLVPIDGVVAVLLGGSRARGDHRPDSDVDLGLYYDGDLDVDALGRLAREIAGPDATVTERGEWGPWVDGGGWLRVGGSPVDWLYRDLRRVREAWADAQAGRYSFHQQVGHPLGVPDFAYAGEVALGVVLADPTGQLTALRAQTQDYPPALTDALVGRGLWEAAFTIGMARKAVPGGDAGYTAGCLFRVVGLCCHALHGRAGRWVVNEKGLVASAARLPVAPAGFGERAQGVFADLRPDAEALATALDRGDILVAETARACAVPG